MLRWLTWSPLITFGIIFAIYFVTAWFRLHPDFGWHLESGRYILAHGVPTTDIFTYTAANFPWVNHEWLNDIWLSIVYGAGGYPLLCFAYAGLWTLATWLVGRKVNSLIIILATIAMAPFAGVAAIVWSVLGLAILINLVKAKDRRLRLLIPLLFLIWVNVHGSFVIGFVYLGYEMLRRRSWRLGILLALSVVLSLVNPYGIELYTEIIRTLADTSLKWHIGEWRAFTIPLMTWPFVLLWLGAFLATSYKNWRKYIGFDVLLLLAGLSSMRNLVLFALVSLAITDERVRIVAKKVVKNLSAKRYWQFMWVGVIIAVAVLGVVIIEGRDNPLDREYYYPVNAVAYLKQHHCSGELFNQYDYGGYLIWKLPGKKVYIDGRMPSWELNGLNYFTEYLKVYSDSAERERQFAKYDIRCVITTRDTSKNSLPSDLIEQKWVVAAEDNNSILLLQP